MNKASVRIALLGALVVAISSVAPSGNAAFHLTKIREVYAETGTNVQFVELQAYSSGQNFVSGHSVIVYDAAGTEITRFTFASSVSNSADNAPILIATPEAETFFDVTADLQMTAALLPAGGKVCFDALDCVSWGSYSGSSVGTGTPYDATNGLPSGMSIERVVTGGTDTAGLDGADDTGDSAADFAAATPSPTPNQTVISDPPPPRTRITRPDQGETYRAGRLTTFRGTATSDFEGDITVRIALRRKMRNGACRWWNGGSFVSGACNERRFLDASGGESWTYQLSDKLASSVGTKVRSYTLYSQGQCTCSPFEETDLDRGRNANTFDIR